MRGIHLNKFSVLVLSLILMLLITACSSGDDEGGSPIEFTGVVTAIDGDTLTVGGFSVDISNASVPVAGLNINEEVRVTGLSEGTTIVAVVVVLVNETTDDPTDEPQPTTAPEVTDAVPPEETDDAPPDATDMPTTEPEDNNEAPPVVVDGDPLIVIEGPVESITINTITIFDIDIEVDPADPILTEIRIGDTIRIEGSSSFDGGTIIIIAVNITIIETTIIVINNPVFVAPGIPANCRVKKSGRITCRGSRRSSRGS